MTITIVLFIVAIIVVGVFFGRKNKPSALSQTQQSNPPSNNAEQSFVTLEEASAFVEKLEEVGYYKYADTENIDSLKKDLAETIARYGILSTVEDEKTLLPLDYRYYRLDGETLFEYQGFTDILQDMKPTFEKIGLAIEITNHLEEANGYLDHRITINGKEYIIFQHFDGYGWGEAAQRFAEIFNDQLELQNKEERIYLINGANDGVAVFLTETQFNLIDALLQDEKWKPLKVIDWCNVFNVDPTKYMGNA